MTPIEHFLSHKDIAVVGASNDGAKYGNIVFRDLRDKGYNVIPVNPKAESIEGVPCRSNLASLAGEVSAAVLIVPPSVTLSVVREAQEAGVTHIWMQPGAESPEAIEFCAQHDIAAIHHDCVMVQAQKRAD